MCALYFYTLSPSDCFSNQIVSLFVDLYKEQFRNINILMKGVYNGLIILLIHNVLFLVGIKTLRTFNGHWLVCKNKKCSGFFTNYFIIWKSNNFYRYQVFTLMYIVWSLLKQTKKLPYLYVWVGRGVYSPQSILDLSHPSNLWTPFFTPII